MKTKIMQLIHKNNDMVNENDNYDNQWGKESSIYCRNSYMMTKQQQFFVIKNIKWLSGGGLEIFLCISGCSGV